MEVSEKSARAGRGGPPRRRAGRHRGSIPDPHRVVEAAGHDDVPAAGPAERHRQPAAAIVYAAAFKLVGTNVFHDDGTGLVSVLIGLMTLVYPSGEPLALISSDQLSSSSRLHRALAQQENSYHWAWIFGYS